MTKFRDFLRSVNPRKAERPAVESTYSPFACSFPQVRVLATPGALVTQSTRTPGRWLVAIDGGGSKIAGVISKQEDNANCKPSVATIRRILDGTGSAATATWNNARNNLIQMFRTLLNEASLGPDEISHAVLMLAGAGRPDDVARVRDSLLNDSPFGSCAKLTVTSDIQPLLFEARDSHPALPSIVVIAGTGSLVAGLDASENVVRTGGWGPVLGDEGSGWGLARAFLQRLCSWIDHHRDSQAAPEGLPALNEFLKKKEISIDPQKLSSAILALASDRHVAAQLAPSILELATQPSMTATLELVNQQIEGLAKQVQQVHSRLDISTRPWRLCLAGGLASNDPRFQSFLTTALKQLSIAPVSVIALDPLSAALRFASKHS